jgi:hypothetical protein
MPVCVRLANYPITQLPDYQIHAGAFPCLW